MTAPAATSERPEFWPEVQRLLGREGKERELVRALLGRVVQETDATGAALYLEGTGGLCQEVAVGAWDADSAANESSRKLPVPGGEVRYLPPVSPGENDAPAPATAATLATAVYALRLREREKRQRFEVAYRGVELEALYDVGLAIASTLNLEEVSEGILLRAVSLLDARRGALYLERDGALELDRTFGGDARVSVPADAPEVTELLESGDGGELDLLPGAEHLMAVAIESEGRRKGVLVVADKESRQGVGPFESTDLRTLSLFANQAAIALENAHLHRQALEKERLERETELAADIQRRLLPESLPSVEGFEVAAWNRPARLVGGDYYGVLSLPEKRLVSVVGDVTGKGMPAALLVSNLHSALHLLLEQESLGPVLLDRLNRHILESSTPNKFITMFLSEIDEPSGTVRYLNAGHNFPVLVNAAGESTQLRKVGMPLGLFAGSSYEVGEMTMNPGDLLCCYSDGITECESPSEEEFGTERLTDLLTEKRDLPLGEVMEAIDNAVLQFAEGAPQGDDQTVVLIRRR